MVWERANNNWLDMDGSKRHSMGTLNSNISKHRFGSYVPSMYRRLFICTGRILKFNTGVECARIKCIGIKRWRLLLPPLFRNVSEKIDTVFT